MEQLTETQELVMKFVFPSIKNSLKVVIPWIAMIVLETFFPLGNIIRFYMGDLIHFLGGVFGLAGLYYFSVIITRLLLSSESVRSVLCDDKDNNDENN